MERELEYEGRLTKVETQSLQNSQRISDLEKRQNDLETLTVTVHTVSVKQESMSEDVREVKSDIKELKAIPSNRWENIVTLLIGGAVGALVSWLTH